MVSTMRRSPHASAGRRAARTTCGLPVSLAFPPSGVCRACWRAWASVKQTMTRVAVTLARTCVMPNGSTAPRLVGEGTPAVRRMRFRSTTCARDHLPHPCRNLVSSSTSQRTSTREGVHCDADDDGFSGCGENHCRPLPRWRGVRFASIRSRQKTVAHVIAPNATRSPCTRRCRRCCWRGGGLASFSPSDLLRSLRGRPIPSSRPSSSR